jgi:hypothetical protein
MPTPGRDAPVKLPPAADLVTEHSVEGATLAEAVALSRWPGGWGAFVRAWEQGRSELAAGEDTPLSRWVEDVRASRAACTQSLRAQLLGEARPNKVRLDLLRRLEEDSEPAELRDDVHEGLFKLSAVQRGLIEDALSQTDIDVDGMVASAGGWTVEGAEAAAADHARRRVKAL